MKLRKQNKIKIIFGAYKWHQKEDWTGNMKILKIKVKVKHNGKKNKKEKEEYAPILN